MTPGGDASRREDLRRRYHSLEMEEQRRRDLRSIPISLVAFYISLLLSAQVYSSSDQAAGPKRLNIKYTQIKETPPQEVSTVAATPPPLAQPKERPLVAPPKPKERPRESVLPRTPPPEPKPVETPDRFKPTMPEPEMWDAQRAALEQQAKAALETVKMPEPVIEAQKKLSDDKPAPIEKTVADVQQTRALEKKKVEMVKDAAAAPKEKVLPKEIEAPKEVARRASESDFKPAAEKAAEPPVPTPEKQIQRAIDQKSEQTAKVDVKEAARMERSAPAAEPDAWKADRAAQLSQRHEVRTDAAALPKEVADRKAAATLGDKAMPMEAGLPIIDPNVELGRSKVAGPSGQASPVSTKTDIPQANVAAPVDVARNRAKSDYKPQAVATPAEMVAAEQKAIQREVARPAAPVAEVAVTPDAGPKIDLPDVAAPTAWESSRTGKVAEKHAVRTDAAALPKEVADRNAPTALGDKAKPMEAGLVNVAPTNIDLHRAQVSGPSAQARPVSTKTDVPQANVAAPVDVARNRAKSDYKPQADVGPAEVVAAEQKAIRREVARSAAPVAEVAVTPDAGPKIDLPDVADPTAWEFARTGKVAEKHEVRASSSALPREVADRKGTGTLGDKARPVEAGLANVAPTNVDLHRTQVAGPSAQARPASTKTDVPQANVDAPVAVTRKDVSKGSVPVQSPQRTESVRSSDVVTTSATRSTGQRVASEKSAVSAPVVPDAPASADAPEYTPDKWADASRTAQPAMAERTSIQAGAVFLPTRVSDRVDTFAVSTARYDVDVENVVSEFDFITLSDKQSGAAPISGPAGEGAAAGAQRRLIRSDQPQIPVWYEEKGMNSIGTFKVHVTKDGDVESVDIDKTTGFKDIDTMWIASIMNWKYEKGDAPVTRLVKVRIKLKK